MTTTTLHIIDTNELLTALRREEITEYWNVLTDDYFTGELIAGSRWVPLERVGREATLLTKETPIIVYCSGPTCPHSKSAGEKLATLGFSNVRVYEGGLEAWKSTGRGFELTGVKAAA